MLIDTPGKYLTRAGEVVDIVRVDRTTAVGRLSGVPEALVWDINTGDALGHPLENSLVGKHRNLPAVALQVAQVLGSLDSKPGVKQRLEALEHSADQRRESRQTVTERAMEIGSRLFVGVALLVLGYVMGGK